MSLFRRLHAAYTFVKGRAAAEEHLDEEISGFYQEMAQRHVEEGFSEQEAHRHIRLQYGGAELTKQRVREARPGFQLDCWYRDLQLALRTLRKAPAFALVTISALAIGIGANSTIFAIVNRFVLQAPPVLDPEALLAIHTTDRNVCCNNFSWPTFADLRDQGTTLSLSAYYELLPSSIGGAGDPERVWGQAVTGNFFDVARFRLSLGRGFAASEETAHVVVLSYGLWQRRFGSDPQILGKPVLLSGKPFTVTGIAPPHFRGLDVILDAQFWVPLGTLDELLPHTTNRLDRNYHWLAVVGRLHPGVSRSRAAAELRVIAQRLAAAHPDIEKDLGFYADRAGSLPSRDKKAILLFLATLGTVALLVLFIGCSNVTNLALAHAVERRHEMSIRLALGAGRRDLLRQLMVESTLLAIIGGLVGALLSFAATQGLAAFRLPAPVPLNLLVSTDWRVLLFVFALSLVTGILFALVPSWIIIRPLLSRSLTQPQSHQHGHLWTLRNLLVMGQMAMSLTLLCATGLFLRSLQKAAHIDIGFRNSGVLMMSIDPRLDGYDAPKISRLLTTLRERASTLPGVLSVAVPLNGGHRSDGISVEGLPLPNQLPIVELYRASPGYFDTLGIPRLSGRDFSDDLSPAIVNQKFARALFPHQNPVGQRVRDGATVFQIIGVVADTKSRTIGEDDRPILYRSLLEDTAVDPSLAGYALLVRYFQSPAAITGAVRRQIHELDPRLAVYDVATMQEHMRDALFLPRLSAALFTVFGGIGLLMAGIGLYGVMAYAVTRRTREIGVRLAVGASRSQVQALILGQGMLLLLIAAGPGLAAAWAGSRVLAGLLYGLSTHDPFTFLTVPPFLAAIALAACWFPGRRAARIDPNIALRHD